jgi:hypothetical protein
VCVSVVVLKDSFERSPSIHRRAAKFRELKAQSGSGTAGLDGFGTALVSGHRRQSPEEEMEKRADNDEWETVSTYC